MKLEIFRLKQGSEINEVSFKSYHVLIIEKLFPSAAWAKTQMLHKSRDPSWHSGYPVSLLVKSCRSLTSSSNKQCGVSLWLSQVETFSLSEQASKKLTCYSNKITSSFENWMPSATQHYWIAQDNHEKKILVNVSKPNHFIRLLFLSPFFSTKG